MKEDVKLSNKRKHHSKALDLEAVPMKTQMNLLKTISMMKTLKKKVSKKNK